MQIFLQSIPFFCKGWNGTLGSRVVFFPDQEMCLKAVPKLPIFLWIPPLEGWVLRPPNDEEPHHSSEVAATYGTDCHGTELGWSWYRLTCDISFVYRYTMYVFFPMRKTHVLSTCSYFNPTGIPSTRFGTQIQFDLWLPRTWSKLSIHQRRGETNKSYRRPSPLGCQTLPKKSQICSREGWVFGIYLRNLWKRTASWWLSRAILASWVGELFSSRVWLSKKWAKLMNVGNIELVLFLFGSIGWKHFDLWNFGFFVVMEFPCISVLICLDSLDSTWGTFASKKCC